MIINVFKVSSLLMTVLQRNGSRVPYFNGISPHLPAGCNATPLFHTKLCTLSTTSPSSIHTTPHPHCHQHPPRVVLSTASTTTGLTMVVAMSRCKALSAHEALALACTGRFLNWWSSQVALTYSVYTIAQL
jgi:hypothetical protein